MDATIGSPAGVICPRCRRLAMGGWGQRRQCSPKDWVHCIRDPFDVISGSKPFGWVMLYAPRAPVGGSAARGMTAPGSESGDTDD